MTFKHTIKAFAIIVLSILATVQAQWGFDPMMGDPMAGMNQLMSEQQQWAMQLSQYDQQMDAFVQQQMQLAQQSADQAYADLQMFFINYYRQNTGDYTTPDGQAVVLGDQLYCQHYPQKCQQLMQTTQSWSQQSAAAHQQNMNTIAAWGNTMHQVGQVNSGILDMQQQAYLDNANLQFQGQQQLIQQGIHGTTTFLDPNTNSAYTGLPVNAYHGMIIQTPYGQNAVFDQSSQSWYLLDAYGYPVQQLQSGF